MIKVNFPPVFYCASPYFKKYCLNTYRRAPPDIISYHRYPTAMSFCLRVVLIFVFFRLFSLLFFLRRVCFSKSGYPLDDP